jgi:hypothetical protein
MGTARRLPLCLFPASWAALSGEAAAEGNLIENVLQALDDAELRQMYRRQCDQGSIAQARSRSSGKRECAEKSWRGKSPSLFNS